MWLGFRSRGLPEEDETPAMCEFSNFINSCHLVDFPLEGVRFTWSSHEEVPTLSHIDRFLFSVEWDDHYRGAHQVALSKITSNHVLILLHWVIFPW